MRVWLVVAACGVAAATCTGGLHRGHDDPPTAIKYAGAGSLQLTGHASHEFELEAGGLQGLQPDDLTFYVQANNGRAQVGVMLHSSDNREMQIIYAWANTLSLRMKGSPSRLTVGSVTLNKFEKVRLAFDWGAHSYTVYLNDVKLATKILRLINIEKAREVIESSHTGYIDELEFSCRPTYALSPDTCVDGDATVTVQVTKGTKTLSTADKIAIVPETATDCAQAATQCHALNGCSEAADLMLAGENLVWNAGNLATLAKDTQFKVCHQLSGGAYELLAGTFRTCVALPTFAVKPAACLDGEAAVTVEVTKGTDRLSTADDIALVLDSSTDCGGAEMQCIMLGGCSSTVGGLLVVGDDLHWVAGPLPMLPPGSSFKLCYYSAIRGTYSLLAGTITTCAAPLPPVPTPVGCLDPPTPYYVSLPSHTCVNDEQHASQGSERLLQYGTKAECCNGLTPKERRECLKAEVVSEVYPDFEKGRCVSDTLRPAVTHPACGVTAAGANKFVARRFLKASLLVSDKELPCKRVYGGIDEAAVDRCVAGKGTWYYVDGMGLVQDDPLVDDPVVYATARTVGSLSSCVQTYFPQVPAVMCDTFLCTAPWTSRADRGSIHCGAANDDCTKELCCTAPPAPPVVTCCGYRCTPTGATFLSAKVKPELIPCPPEGCLPSHCCDYDAGEILTPSSAPLAHHPAAAAASGWTYWMIQCGDGQVPDLSIDFVHRSGPTTGTEFIGRQVDASGVETQSFHLSGGSSTGHAHLAATRVMTFAFYHETEQADGVTMRYECVDKP